MMGGGERTIDLADVRERISDNERYTNPWSDFCPEPDVVLALVEAVEAAQALRKMQAVRVVISPGMEQWIVGQGYIRNLDNALARFSFRSSGGNKDAT